MFKKLFISLLVLGILLVSISLSQADSTRTIQRKTAAVTADTLVSASGCVVYKVTGYATGSNAIYALRNSANLAIPPDSTVKVEGGEATQWDGLPLLDFGDEGIVFDTGLVITTNDAAVVVEYN